MFIKLGKMFIPAFFQIYRLLLKYFISKLGEGEASAYTRGWGPKFFENILT